jgi:hypothetical protein
MLTLNLAFQARRQRVELFHRAGNVQKRPPVLVLRFVHMRDTLQPFAELCPTRTGARGAHLWRQRTPHFADMMHCLLA